jgi:uncharacterized membrane protein
MPRVEQSILIQVPVKDAFDWIAHQLERMAVWWPPMELHEPLSAEPVAVGSVWRYVFNMLGVRISGEQVVQRLQPDETLEMRATSGLDSIFCCHFDAAAPDATRLTVTLDYRLPGSMLGELLSRTSVEIENMRNLEIGLRNLKQLLECSPAVGQRHLAP